MLSCLMLNKSFFIKEIKKRLDIKIVDKYERVKQ